MAIKHGQRRKPCEFRPQEPGNQRSGGREELTCRLQQRGPPALRRPRRAAPLVQNFLKEGNPAATVKKLNAPYLGSRDPDQGRRRGHEERRVDGRLARAAGVD